VLNAIVTAVFVNASGKAVSRSVTDVSCSALPVQLDCGFPRTGEDQEARLERIPEHFSWGGPKEFSVGSGVPSLARGTLQFLNHPTRLTKDMVCLFVSSLCSREGSFRNCRGKITSAS